VKKLDRRYSSLLNALLMAIILPFFMTFVVSAINIGFADRLIGAWMKTWLIASVAAFPLIVILAPLIKRLIAAVTE
jgi:hypothetical protein